MDTIKFAAEETLIEGASYRIPVINIYINGRNLIDLVEQVERRSRQPDPEESSSGPSYVGLHTGHYPDFRDEFLGRTGRSVSILLLCTCLQALCNSIVAGIEFGEDTVTWREIRSPFLAMEVGKWVEIDEAEAAKYAIDYSGLGPFVFDRTQYMNALDELA